jgi:DNA polymerase III subunit delta
MAKRSSRSHASSAPRDKRSLLADELRGGVLRPIYVFEGSDQHRIDQVVQFIRNLVVAPGSEAFNVHILDAESQGWAGILRQARSLSMFGGKQFILARYCDRIKASAQDPGEAAFNEYLQTPVDSTVLIITGEKFDGRRSWMKIAKDKDCHVHFPPPSGAELLNWIRRAARDAGLILDQEAVALLADLVGSDLNSLQAEINKLRLLQDMIGKPPDHSMLLEHILDQHEVDVFSLTDAASPDHGPEMLRNWFQQVNQGKNPEELIPLLLTHLRRAILVANCLADGISEKDIAAETGINAWMLRNKLSPMARRLDAAMSAKLIRSCLDSDFALKTRPIASSVVVEELLATIHSIRWSR